MANTNKCYAVLDFETGGLSSEKNPIVEVAIAIYDDSFRMLESYEAVIAPYHHEYKNTAFDKLASAFTKAVSSPTETIKKLMLSNCTPESLEYEEQALSVNGLSMDRILDEGKPIKTVAQDIKALLKRHSPTSFKKPIFVAHNASFDYNFLFHFDKYGKCDIKSCFDNNFICTLSLSRLAFPQKSSHKLSIMCDEFDIELENAHTALPDVLATGELLEALTLRMRGEDSGNSKTEQIEEIKKEFNL